MKLVLVSCSVCHVLFCRCSDFSAHYGSCKKAVDLLATMDCLFSLAKVAKMPGYTWLVLSSLLNSTLYILFDICMVIKAPAVYACLMLCYSPEMVEDQVIEIEDGRHPVIDQLLGEGEQYVPNDTSMSVSQQKRVLISCIECVLVFV